MALDRLGGYLNGYNPYDVRIEPKTPETLPQQIPPQEEQKVPEQKEPEQKPGLELTVEEIPSRENASIENVAISFGVYDASSIELFGDKGLASDEMKQAISGLQKDKILQEYQYFVGNKDMTGKPSNVIAGTEDGIVIKLN